MKEAIHFTLAYMYGGNRVVQYEYHEHFLEDTDNEILEKIAGYLTKYFDQFEAREISRTDFLYQNCFGYMFEYCEEYNKDTFKIHKMAADVNEMVPSEEKIDAFYVRQNRYIIFILTFLQMLCEKQCTELQNFVREQKDDERPFPHSFNFIQWARNAFGAFVPVCNSYNIEIGLQLVDMLTDSIQGRADENVKTLLGQSLIYDVCKVLTDYKDAFHLIPRGFDLNPYTGPLMELKARVIDMLKALAEYPQPAFSQIINKHIDKAGLLEVFEEIMYEFFGWNQDNLPTKNAHKVIAERFRTLTNEEVGGVLGAALNIYMIFRQIWEDNFDFEENLKELIEDPVQNRDDAKQKILSLILFNFCSKIVASIEVVMNDEDETLIQIWFPIFPVCRYLPASTRHRFEATVDRSNSQTKINQFTSAFPEFLNQMETEFQSRSRLFGLNWSNFYSFLGYGTNILALVLIVLHLATWEYVYDTNLATQENQYQQVYRILAIIQTILAFVLVLLWLVLYRKRHLALMWEKYTENNVRENGTLPPTITSKLQESVYKKIESLDSQECTLILKLCGINSEEWEMVLRRENLYRKVQAFHVRKSIQFSLSSPRLSWQCLYFVICLLSIPYASRYIELSVIFSSLQLIDFTLRSNTISQISLAVIRNWKQFMWTIFLLFLAILIYTLIGFFYLNTDFYDDLDDVLYCPDAIRCFVNVLNLGLRNGGGIADAMVEPYAHHENIGRFVARVFFDLSFFIIMITLLLNLIFGMIIDAFGDLRDQKTYNDDDQKNVCFICGYERSEFERHGNFENHILKEHNTYNYLYYLVYVHDKNKNHKVEMSALENMVMEKYMSKENDWIPIGRSMVLEKDIKSDNQNSEKSIVAIKQELTEINKKLGKLEENL